MSDNPNLTPPQDQTSDKANIPGGVELNPEMIAQLSDVTNPSFIAQAQADALATGGLFADLLFAKKVDEEKK